MNKVYTIDYKKLIKLSLPTLLRGVKLVAWLECLFAPLISWYLDFVSYKNDAVYRVSHNASITLLQKVLNDKFDNIQRRIYIKNVQRQDSLRLYSRNANRDIGIYTNAKNSLRTSIEGGLGLPDFTVHIPVEYRPVTQLEIDKYLIVVGSQIKYYKLYAKQYTIIWIE